MQPLSPGPDTDARSVPQKGVWFRGFGRPGPLHSGPRPGHRGPPSRPGSPGSPGRAAFTPCRELRAQLGLGKRVWGGVRRGEPCRGAGFVLDLKPAVRVGVRRTPAGGVGSALCVQRRRSSLFTEAPLPSPGPPSSTVPPRSGGRAAENSSLPLGASQCIPVEVMYFCKASYL